MKKWLMMLIFYGLYVFAGDVLFCPSDKPQPNNFFSQVSIPDDIFLKIFSFVVPGYSLLNHSEQMIEYVFEFMKYRPVCTAWRDSFDKHITSSITFKQMYYGIVNQNNFNSLKFTTDYKIYLEMPFLEKFLPFLKSQKFLIDCCWRLENRQYRWYEVPGYTNECNKKLEVLAQNGIVLKSFCFLLKTEEFALWKKLFEITMQNFRGDLSLKILFANQYCNYVKQHPEIESLFKEYHDDFKLLVLENPEIIPVTLEDVNYFYFLEYMELKRINNCVAKNPWLSDCICTNLLLSFNGLGPKNMRYRDEICKILNEINFDKHFLIRSNAKKFLQMITMLNRQLTHQQDVKILNCSFNMKNKQFYAYFIYQFYYNLVQLFVSGVIIDFDALTKQSDIMKHFFLTCKNSFNRHSQEIFLRTLLESIVIYYFNEAHGNKTVAVPTPKERAQKKLQLKVMFYGFKLMILYSFLSSVDNQSFLKVKYKKTFEKHCNPFLKCVDSRMASFLSEYFK